MTKDNARADRIRTLAEQMTQLHVDAERLEEEAAKMREDAAGILVELTEVAQGKPVPRRTNAVPAKRAAPKHTPQRPARQTSKRTTKPGKSKAAKSKPGKTKTKGNADPAVDLPVEGTRARTILNYVDSRPGAVLHIEDVAKGVRLRKPQVWSPLARLAEQGHIEDLGRGQGYRSKKPANKGDITWSLRDYLHRDHEKAYHRVNTASKLAKQTGLPEEKFRAALTRFVSEGELTADGEYVRVTPKLRTRESLRESQRHGAAIARRAKKEKEAAARKAASNTSSDDDASEGD